MDNDDIIRVFESYLIDSTLNLMARESVQFWLAETLDIV